MRFRLVAPFAVFTVCVAGCTGGGSGSPTTSAPSSVVTSVRATSTGAPSTSAPRSSSMPTSTVPTTGPNVRPGEKPPVLPASAQVNTPAAAITFAQYWFRTLDWAYATTDSTLPRTVFSRSCTDCSTFVRVSIDEVQSAGHHFRGGRISAVQTSLRPTDHHFGATMIVDVTVDQTKLDVVDGTGRVTESTPAVRGDVFRTWLRWRSTHWELVDWKRAVSK